MKKKLFLIPIFCLVSALASCQSAGGSSSDSVPSEGDESEAHVLLFDVNYNLIPTICKNGKDQEIMDGGLKTLINHDMFSFGIWFYQEIHTATTALMVL